MSSPDPGQEGIRPAGAPRPAPTRRRAEPAEPVEPAAPRARLTTLLGKEVGEQRRLPFAGLLYLLLALLCLGLSVSNRSPGLFVFGFLGFGAFALVYLLLRPAALRLRFTEEGVEFPSEPACLPYARLQEVFAPRSGGKAKRFPIYLLYEDGQVALPAKLRTSSAELYDFLRSQPPGCRDLPAVDPLFRDFLRQQVALHGAGPIYVYRARQPEAPSYRGRTWRDNAWRRLALALVLTGAAWAAGVAGCAQLGLGPLVDFLGAILAVLVVAVFCFLVSLLAGRPARVPKRWRNATLILTPAGLALMQGQLQGELRWKELRGLKVKSGSFVLSRTDTTGPGLELRVPGASLLIADIYHWPLAHIEHVIRTYAGL